MQQNKLHLAVEELEADEAPPYILDLAETMTIDFAER